MRNPLLVALVFCACAFPETTPPASFTQAETIPARPSDVDHPMTAVRWVLNYDLSQFDSLWDWLQTVPPSPERSRAIGAAALMGVAELDRTELRQPGIDAFDEAIAAFPDDARLPLWRGYIRFQQAVDAHDATAMEAALNEMRASTSEYPSFTPFGLTLGIGGLADATPAQLEEAKAAFDLVVNKTYDLQFASGGVDRQRNRRTWDSPIAPYNLSAMQAMIGDLAARMGNKNLALQSYYTALRVNNGYRWPWRAEVQRRMEHVDDVIAGFAAKTEYALGSRQVGAIGTPEAVRDARFAGRIGNGSCTVCHTHVSNFDLNEPVVAVGWVKIKIAPLKNAPGVQSATFLLPDGKDPIPSGFAFGPTVDVAAGSDFDSHDELFDDTQYIPAEPGHWFVATQTQLSGKKYQGYSAREFGLQQFFDVKAGEVIDFTAKPIVFEPQK